MINIIKSTIKIIVDKTLEISSEKILTYENTVEYLLNNKPRDNRELRGALIIEKKGSCYITILAFLDESGELACDDHGVPYGCKRFYKTLDDEIIEYLGENSLLIFE